MTSLSWLHLTDLHWGMKGQRWLWPQLQEVFEKDLETLHKVCGPWDLVFFTGDLVCQGSKDEFEKLNRFLDRLWGHLGKLGSQPALLAVPGNHDLARPDSEDPATVILREWGSRPKVVEQFWEKPRSDYRRVVTKAFQNYTAWWENHLLRPPGIRSGLLPGDFSVTVAKQGMRFGILGLNTTFLQLTGADWERRLDVDVRQFQEACGDEGGPQWAAGHDVCILLTHQPPQWLSVKAREQFNGEIALPGRFAVHLFGHMHEADLSNIATGGEEARLLSQGRSLFGMEFFAAKESRIHGYSAGRIELQKAKAFLTLWPRAAVKRRTGERRIVPDHEGYELVDNVHTTPLEVRLRHQALAKAAAAAAGAALAAAPPQRVGRTVESRSDPAAEDAVAVAPPQPVKSGGKSYELIFDLKFKRVELEIDNLLTEIRMTKTWIVNWHTFSPQELLESPRWGKIYSISEKIAADVENWARTGAFGEDGMAVYQRSRARVARRLAIVRKAIEQRQPTWWEKLAGLVGSVAAIVMQRFPTIAKLAKLARRLLPEQKNTKLLPLPRSSMKAV